MFDAAREAARKEGYGIDQVDESAHAFVAGGMFTGFSTLFFVEIVSLDDHVELRVAPKVYETNRGMVPAELKPGQYNQSQADQEATKLSRLIVEYLDHPSPR